MFVFTWFATVYFHFILDKQTVLVLYLAALALLCLPVLTPTLTGFSRPFGLQYLDFHE